MYNNDMFFLINQKLFADNSIMYVSCPITTGKRFIQWYRDEGKNYTLDSDEFFLSKHKRVISKNVAEAKLIIQNQRQSTNKVIIDPTNLEDDSLNWSQDEYYQFWDRVIIELVDEIMFLDGWEYSIGCSVEYLSAVKKNIKRYSQNGEVLSLGMAISKLSNSINEYTLVGLDTKKLKEIYSKLLKYEPSEKLEFSDLQRKRLKHDKLDYMLTTTKANIAQFISVDPNEKTSENIKHVHISNSNYTDSNCLKDTILALIKSSTSNAVNIRSFSTEVTKGNALVYNKKEEDIDEILDIIKKNIANNRISIVNENIDINDGGVSGVYLGNIIEFAPEDTPKCVDKEDVCSLPRDLGEKILKNVYGITIPDRFPRKYRVEFSMHPKPQGIRKEHIIIWEYEEYDHVSDSVKIVWPNKFSKFIGDKVFGLLIADALGFNIPQSTVISRKVAPFVFGRPTGRIDKWIRTCPIVKEPGKFYTGNLWEDPFELINNEEKKGDKNVNIASIISQDAVKSLYSGASFIRKNQQNDLIEGVVGSGDLFMVGEQEIEQLPERVINEVELINNNIRQFHYLLGDVSIEWVYDGEKVWIVQMNQISSQIINEASEKQIIVDGNVKEYITVHSKDGLDNLREKIKQIKNKGIGIELIGNIGITSHFGDLLRLAEIPSRLVRK